MLMSNFVRNIMREIQGGVASIGDGPFVWNLRTSKSTVRCYAYSLNVLSGYTIGTINI
jgi:hypothetical protein